jgi:ComF family protein
MQVSNQKSAHALLKKAGIGILEFLLPSRCPGCGDKLQSHGYLCPKCWGNLTPLARPFCDTCALPFEFETDDNSQCGACLQSPPAFDWARAAVTYDELGRSLVIRLKYGGTTSYIPAMARMMAGAAIGRQIDVVMPVPLHRRRLLSRRFNQSQLLAQALSRENGIPYDGFSLKKKRATKSQGGLNRKERFHNVRASFSVENPRAVEGKHILLVDDVLTTGATAEACTKALKKAGASEVGVVAFARVGKPVAG